MIEIVPGKLLRLNIALVMRTKELGDGYVIRDTTRQLEHVIILYTKGIWTQVLTSVGPGWTTTSLFAEP